MDAEDTPPRPFASDLTYPVKFQVFGGSVYNRDLKGSGTLNAQADARAFRFVGRSRKVFKRGEQEMVFSGDDIRNVVASGKTVQFSTGLGESGRLKKPFIFYCETRDDANAIATLLPKQKDEDFVAGEEFYAKLKQLTGTDNPLFSATNILIAVNVAVFLIMAGLLGCGWIEAANLRPYIRYGASNGAATTDGEWWRLITAMFIHFGIAHLALNMWALYQSGQLVEKLLGKALYTLTYFGAGIAGGFLSLVWNGDKVWSAGASGAIFGVYGALLGYMIREKHSLPRSVLQPLMKSTLTFAGYNLLYGLVHPGIDVADHVGGLLGGIILGWICAQPLDPSLRSRTVVDRFLLAGLAIIIMAGIGAYAAPRYPYSVREELLWSDSVRSFAEPESALVRQQDDDLLRWRQKGDNAASFELLIEKNLVPLYSDFSTKIGSLILTPGRLTDQRRSLLQDFLRTKAEGYEHLDRAVRDHDKYELQEYEDSETEGKKILQSIHKLAG
jgi:rhomboid protease GluP